MLHSFVMRGGVVPVLMVLVGCAPCSPSREAPERGVPADPGESPATSPTDAPTPPPSRRPTAPEAPGPSGELQRSSPSDDDPSEEDVDPRDLVEELRSALGGLDACVANRAGDVPERSRVQVTVHVTERGIVSRASVKAADWSSDARRCVERRARQVRFRSPVPRAPRSVTAALTVHAPPPPPAEPRDEPWQPSSGVPITDVPGREPEGPQGEMIDDVPGREPEGPQGEMIDDVPGLEPSGPQGKPPSH